VDPRGPSISLFQDDIMKLLKEIAFASALTLAALPNPMEALAHETKLGDLVISHPWSRTSPMKANVSAGFMKITNNGTTDDRLVKATSDIAPVVQLHDMKMDGDVMKMFEVDGGIVIPAGQTVELKPKSLHVMFMQVAKQPEMGTSFKATLTFEKAGTVEVEFEVTDGQKGMH
jgi:periplasmic copper chaperone A